MFVRWPFAVTALSLFFASCGSQRSSESSSLASVSPDRVAAWEEWAPRCEGYPSKAAHDGQICNDGDMTLFGGLLCASGASRGCDLVRDAQGADGRWWRSPRRVGNNDGEQNSFSRDMAMGVILYLVTTKDVVAAENWMDWILSNRACLFTNPFPPRQCLQRVPAYRFCTDETGGNRCTLMPGSWGLLNRVWRDLGLDPRGPMTEFQSADGEPLVAETLLSQLGYALHLQAVEVFFKQKIGASQEFRSQAASIAAQRQPGNPFFQYLSAMELTAGETRTNALLLVQQKVEDLCPQPGIIPADATQWSWERDTAGAEWTSSMGWECIFMARLLENL